MHPWLRHGGSMLGRTRDRSVTPAPASRHAAQTAFIVLPATDTLYGFQDLLFGRHITFSTFASFPRLLSRSFFSLRRGMSFGIGCMLYSLPSRTGIFGCIRNALSASSSLRLSAVSTGGLGIIAFGRSASWSVSRSKPSIWLFVKTCFSHFCTSSAASLRFETVSLGLFCSFATTAPRGTPLQFASVSLVIGSRIMHFKRLVLMWTFGSSPFGRTFSHLASALQPS
mmetsp:Transcript_48180/g.136101  ORF Transcript_48180/g.136101 Transcript_48180/m.136101 type:complete len:226 (-) Transcript_48180:1173-1850(-)